MIESSLPWWRQIELIRALHSRAGVPFGTPVNQGDVVGSVGPKDYMSSGPHLHQELLKQGVKINPRAVPQAALMPGALSGPRSRGQEYNAPRDGGARLHKGLDTGAAPGTPLTAPVPGTVVADPRLGARHAFAFEPSQTFHMKPTARPDSGVQMAAQPYPEQGRLEPGKIYRDPEGNLWQANANGEAVPLNSEADAKRAPTYVGPGGNYDISDKYAAAMKAPAVGPQYTEPGTGRVADEFNQYPSQNAMDAHRRAMGPAQPVSQPTPVNQPAPQPAPNQLAMNRGPYAGVTQPNPGAPPTAPDKSQPGMLERMVTNAGRDPSFWAGLQKMGASMLAANKAGFLPTSPWEILGKGGLAFNQGVEEYLKNRQRQHQTDLPKAARDAMKKAGGDFEKFAKLMAGKGYTDPMLKVMYAKYRNQQGDSKWFERTNYREKLIRERQDRNAARADELTPGRIRRVYHSFLKEFDPTKHFKVDPETGKPSGRYKSASEYARDMTRQLLESKWAKDAR